MIRNPIDAVIAFLKLPVLGEVLKLLSESGEIDNFIVSIPFDWLHDKGEGAGPRYREGCLLPGQAKENGPAISP